MVPDDHRNFSSARLARRRTVPSYGCGRGAGSALKHDLIAILDAHGPALHALLLRLTLRQDVADDLLQELFVKLAGSRSFRAAIDPVAYVKRAAVNLALDWRRARQRRDVSGALDG